MVTPSVAEIRMLADFVSTCHHPSPARRRAGDRLWDWEQWKAARKLVARVYGCAFLFNFYHRLCLRGNACGSPGSRCSLKLNMYDCRKIQERTLPSHWAHIKARSPLALPVSVAST